MNSGVRSTRLKRTGSEVLLVMRIPNRIGVNTPDRFSGIFNTGSDTTVSKLIPSTGTVLLVFNCQKIESVFFGLE